MVDKAKLLEWKITYIGAAIMMITPFFIFALTCAPFVLIYLISYIGIVSTGYYLIFLRNTELSELDDLNKIDEQPYSKSQNRQ
jgi:hypothetical protein